MSDPEMQSIWSRILAGEANKASTFSKRTVDLVSTLDKRDADMFTTLCSFIWDMGSLRPLVFDIKAKFYNDRGVNFPFLQHLTSLGLISVHNFGITMSDYPTHGRANYFDQQILLAQDKPKNLKVGTVWLSQAGGELARISGAKPIDGFIEYVINQWSKDQIVCSSAFPRLEIH